MEDDGGQMAWVQTNVGSTKDAREIMERVVGLRLAACANAWAIDSLYWWKGKLESERETTVHFKTTPEALDDLVAEVRKGHPYEVPYIEWGTAEGAHRPYAEWVSAETMERPSGTRRRT